MYANVQNIALCTCIQGVTKTECLVTCTFWRAGIKILAHVQMCRILHFVPSTKRVIRYKALIHAYFICKNAKSCIFANVQNLALCMLHLLGVKNKVQILVNFDVQECKFLTYANMQDYAYFTQSKGAMKIQDIRNCTFQMCKLQNLAHLQLCYILHISHVQIFIHLQIILQHPYVQCVKCKILHSCTI